MIVSESLSNLVATMAKNNAFEGDNKARENLMDTIQHNVGNHSCFRCDYASFFCDSVGKNGWRLEVAGCKKMLPFNSKADDGYSRNIPFYCSDENQSGLSAGGVEGDPTRAAARAGEGEAALEKLMDRPRP